jgi:hypothetical protein
MSAVPSIRALLTKELLATLRADDPDLMPLVASLLPPALMEAIAKTRVVGWVPFAAQMHLNRAMRQVLGNSAYQDAWRRAMLRSYDQTLLRPLVEGTLRLFGASPQGLSKVMPRIWGVVTRGAGELTLEPPPGPNRAVTLLSGFPRDPGFAELFVLGFAGCMSSIFDVCDVPGEVVVHDLDAEQGTARFELRW